MNKKDLVAAVSEKCGFSIKDSGKAVEAVVASVKEALLDGEKVTLVGFGTFEVRERAAKVGRNPQTGETIEIQASKLPAFRAGKVFKDEINA